MAGRLGALGLFAAVALAGCGDTSAPPRADTIALKLKGQGLPIRQVEPYTEDNDPNKLLGRPGQYVDKVNFRDRRAENDRLKGLDVSEGGSIEVFESEEDAERRTKRSGRDWPSSSR